MQTAYSKLRYKWVKVYILRVKILKAKCVATIERLEFSRFLLA